MYAEGTALGAPTPRNSCFWVMLNLDKTPHFPSPHPHWRFAQVQAAWGRPGPHSRPALHGTSSPGEQRVPARLGSAPAPQGDAPCGFPTLLGSFTVPPSKHSVVISQAQRGCNTAWAACKAQSRSTGMTTGATRDKTGGPERCWCLSCCKTWRQQFPPPHIHVLPSNICLGRAPEGCWP